MRKFKNAVSKGFDPDVHLVKVNESGCFPCFLPFSFLFLPVLPSSFLSFLFSHLTSCPHLYSSIFLSLYHLAFSSVSNFTPALPLFLSVHMPLSFSSSLYSCQSCSCHRTLSLNPPHPLPPIPSLSTKHPRTKILIPLPPLMISSFTLDATYLRTNLISTNYIPLLFFG